MSGKRGDGFRLARLGLGCLYSDVVANFGEQAWVAVVHVVNKAWVVIGIPVILTGVVRIVRLPLSFHLQFKSFALGLLVGIVATIPVIGDIDSLIVPVAWIRAEVAGAAQVLLGPLLFYSVADTIVIAIVFMTAPAPTMAVVVAIVAVSVVIAIGESWSDSRAEHDYASNYF